MSASVSWSFATSVSDAFQEVFDSLPLDLRAPRPSAAREPCSNLLRGILQEVRTGIPEIRIRTVDACDVAIVEVLQNCRRYILI
jgi:hypothetical protein